jgi:mannan endo-1,4-beta-mannosidase
VDHIPKRGRGTTEPEQIYYQFLNKTGAYINYGENGLQRMDYLVSACERFGLKLVLPFTNNWSDWGGINLHMSIFSPSYDYNNWYQTPKCQEVYRDWIKVLVTRYRKSPAIFSWQLMNEPRCAGCDNSVITQWATNISKYIKSLDPGHMISMGDEGWLIPGNVPDGEGPGYDGEDGVDFAGNLMNISTLDYGTFHLYPSTWGYAMSWGNRWITEHDAIGEKVRMRAP